MIKTILVPLDGSTLAERALDTAEQMARSALARIELVLVQPAGATIGANLTPLEVGGVSIAEEYLRTIAARLERAGTPPVGSRVATGDRVERICHLAKRLHADLVVMGTHGRTGFSRAWIGSIADGVVRQSSVPVYLIPSTDESTLQPTSPAPTKNILVALDGSPLAERVLPIACELAAVTGAAITLVQAVVPVPVIATDMATPYIAPIPVVDESTTRLVFDDATAYMARMAAMLQGLPVKTRVVVEQRPAQAILDVAATTHADVIAMTTHGRGASRLLLGSVADKVLRAATMPLLLYRPRMRASKRMAKPPMLRGKTRVAQRA